MMLVQMKRFSHSTALKVNSEQFLASLLTQERGASGIDISARSVKQFGLRHRVL